MSQFPASDLAPPLNPGGPAQPLVNQANAPALLGVTYTVPTLADLAAVPAEYRVSGQHVRIAAEPPGVYRIYDPATIWRKVVVKPGMVLTLADGAQVLGGAGSPGNGSGTAGYAYIDSLSGDVYQKDSTGWHGVSKDVKTVSVMGFANLVTTPGDWSPAIQAALNTGMDVYLPEKLDISRYLLVTTPGQTFYGPGYARAGVRMVNTTHVQPALIVAPSAVGFCMYGLEIDHNADQWPNLAPFVPGLMGALSGDARGIAVLVMADGSEVYKCRFKNGWDNGLGAGVYNLETGQQTPGPDRANFHDIVTEGNGRGKHDWGGGVPGSSFAPEGYYRQGCGIDMLTATNFRVSNCHDFRSYCGFWCDINGGGSGIFDNCVAIETQQGPIWSDSASGSNQIWYTQFFGGTITGPGSGWMKTPGGVAFMSGSYGVKFIGCRAIRPAWIGFALDTYSSGCSLIGCESVDSGGPGLVDAGLRNNTEGLTITNPCTRYGQTAPSGSVCPVIGGVESVGQSADYVETQHQNLVVKGSHAYPGSPSTVNYPYAVYARRGPVSLSVCKPAIFGHKLVPGTLGKCLADTGCSLSVIGADGASLIVDQYGDGAPAVTVMQDGNNGGALQLFLDAGGAGKVINYTTGGELALVQLGSGNISFTVNNSTKARVTAQGLQLFDLANSPAGLPQGTIYWAGGNNLGIA